jgi:hypothetical protein
MIWLITSCTVEESCYRAHANVREVVFNTSRLLAPHANGDINITSHEPENASRLAQLVERVTSNDEVSRSSRLMGN